MLKNVFANTCFRRRATGLVASSEMDPAFETAWPALILHLAATCTALALIPRDLHGFENSFSLNLPLGAAAQG